MFRYARLSIAIALLNGVGNFAHALAEGPGSLSLLRQAQGLPAEFHEYFFDVPLAVRIVLDGHVLGEAMVLLSREERVTLLEFTDTRDSEIGTAERSAWQALLQQGVALGVCETRCSEGLVAVNYSLENSELSLLTQNAERNFAEAEHYKQPDEGSAGLIVRNQLNVSGGQQQDLAARYAVQAITSMGNWTQTFAGQLNRLDTDDNPLQYNVYELHSQKEWQDNFFRLGYFTPDMIGLNRQPRSLGHSPDTVLGLMLGSSDSLVKDGAKPSVYPVHVTANRGGTVEIYRNGVLINTQPVQAGLHALDTRPLPGGIYDVEVRLIEDGIVTSRSNELVYKPNNWSNPTQRWRYNVFLGRESALLSSWDNSNEGGMTAGTALNYLLHPRAVVGLSARQIKGQNQLGTSLDFGLSAQSSLYASVYQAQEHGIGIDVQALYHYHSGNVIFSYNRSWLDNRDTYETLINGQRVRQRNPYNGEVSSTALNFNHRLGIHDSVNVRLSHSQGQINGTGVDLGWMHTLPLFGQDTSWRLSAFDRPGAPSMGGRRNRGVDLSLTLALGGEGRRISASLGSRTSRTGETDRNASVGYQQDSTSGPIRSLNGSLQADTYGVGLAGGAQFDTELATGDVQVQRSSYNNALSGSVNLNSSLVIGANKLHLSGQPLSIDAGMIVDVESDLDDIQLRADDLSGSGIALKPGRNLLPVTAYRAGVVQFDFSGTDAPAASIQPARALYHLNKGGVAYQQVRVTKTLTVLGRLLDSQGLPMKGYHIVNHASRSVTEVDGFFSLELSAKNPTLEVVREEKVICRFSLVPKVLSSEDGVLMAGDLRCVDNAGTSEQWVGY